MPLQDLLEALEEEGAAAHEKAQRDRRRHAEQIVGAARDRADSERGETLSAAERAARREADTILAAARAGARRAHRTARDDALERVRVLAVERLLELPGSPAGMAAALGCAVEALAALPRGTRLHVHPADADGVRSEVSVAVVADLTVGGAVAGDDVGRYVDNTYPTRLANIWPDVRVRLSRSWGRP